MLIQEFLKVFDTPITNLSFMERWGGTVQTYRKPVNGENGEIIGFDTFPISCNVSEADCERDEFYQELIPNDTKKAIAYFEIIQPFAVSENKTYGLKGLRLQGSARFVCWLNTQKLGYNTCNLAALVAPTFVKMFHFAQPDLTGTIFENASRVNIRVTGEQEKSISIFDRYSYNEFKGFLMHPFDYFALDLEVEVLMDTNCFPDFVEQTPIDCYQNTRTT